MRPLRGRARKSQGAIVSVCPSVCLSETLRWHEGAQHVKVESRRVRVLLRVRVFIGAACALGSCGLRKRRHDGRQYGVEEFRGKRGKEVCRSEICDV